MEPAAYEDGVVQNLAQQHGGVTAVPEVGDSAYLTNDSKAGQKLTVRVGTTLLIFQSRSAKPVEKAAFVKLAQAGADRVRQRQG